jgi:hypothetical protein
MRRATSPLFFNGAGYADLRFIPRQKAEGMERRVAHLSLVVPRSLRERGRLSALHRSVFPAPGRAF